MAIIVLLRVVLIVGTCCISVVSAASICIRPGLCGPSILDALFHTFKIFVSLKLKDQGIYWFNVFDKLK
jgi:hypothetical protein